MGDYADWDDIPFLYPRKIRKLSKSSIGNHCSERGCDGVLVLRRNNTTLAEFIGCSNFPKCKISFTVKE